MRGVMLLLAGLVAGLPVQAGLAQNSSNPTTSPNKGIEMINHICINVPDISEAIKYYTEKMGFREGFRSYTEDGKLNFVYLHVSKETFIELQSKPQLPWGVLHYGLWLDDTKAAVDMLRQRGVKVTDANTGTHRPTAGAPPMTGAVIAMIEDPYMRIEMVQISPQQQRAIANYNSSNSTTSPNKGIRMINHVCINVPDISEAIKYYTEKMGFREGFRSYTEDGKLHFVYMHMTKETFIELQSNPQVPWGVTHFGLWVDDAKAAVDMFRQRSVKVQDAHTSTHRPTAGAPPMTGAVIANIEDPYMRIEMVQISPQQQRAIANYK